MKIGTEKALLLFLEVINWNLHVYRETVWHLHVYRETVWYLHVYRETVWHFESEECNGAFCVLRHAVQHVLFSFLICVTA